MAKYNSSGWHYQSERHSKAKRTGHAGGNYAKHFAESHPLSPDSLAKRTHKWKEGTKRIGHKTEALFGRHFGEPNPLSQASLSKRTHRWKAGTKRIGHKTKILFSRHFGKAEKKLTTKQKKHIAEIIKHEHKEMALTHPRKVGGNSGMFYLKAGKIHKTNPRKDTRIKAEHKRSKHDDSWRGDVKGSRF
jgi:hypothetical protein